MYFEGGDLSETMGHIPECPCNNAGERGCFLISAETNRCVSCICPSEDFPEVLRAAVYEAGYRRAAKDVLELMKKHEVEGDWCMIIHSCDLFDDIYYGMLGDKDD